MLILLGSMLWGSWMTLWRELTWIGILRMALTNTLKHVNVVVLTSYNLTCPMILEVLLEVMPAKLISVNEGKKLF